MEAAQSIAKSAIAGEHAPADSAAAGTIAAGTAVGKCNLNEDREGFPLAVFCSL